MSSNPTAPADIAILGGTVVDGTGARRKVANVGITNGRISSIGTEQPVVGPDTRVIDAEGKWVTPGFIDVHTHYDAEVLVAPSLSESIRHGVTTVVTGNCSLSAVYSPPVDVADLFSRVEALPREGVMRAVTEQGGWSSPQEW